MNNQAMNNQALITHRDQAKQDLNVLGVNISVLASREDTQNWSMTLQKGGEGMGPPPHKHDWDESFYVLNGEVEFSYDGKSALCGAGTLVHVPAGTVHGFQFGKAGGEMLEITSKNSNAVKMFSDISEHFPTDKPDMPSLLAMMASNGVSVQMS